MLHTGFSLMMEGPLDVDALRMAVTSLGTRHELLHTGFAAAPDGVLAAHRGSPQSLLLIDVSTSGDPSAAGQTAHRRTWAEIFPFDGTPLVRPFAIRFGPTTHVVACVTHQLISDGFSVDTMREELAHFYNAHHSGELPPALPALTRQFFDLSADDAESSGADLEYWRHRLRDLPPLVLPGQRSSKPDGDVVLRQRDLSPRAPALLANFCREQGSTPYAAFVSVLLALTLVRTGQPDLRVGGVWDTRPTFDRSVVGPFTQGIAVRVDLRGTRTFADVHHRVRSALFESMTHQNVDFEELVELMESDGTPRSQLLPIVASFQETRSRPPAMHGLATSYYEPEEEPVGATDGLYIELVSLESALRCSAYCDGRLLDGSALETLLSQLDRLFDQALTEPSRTLGELVNRAGSPHTDARYPA
jgi:hypothetical protein